MNFTAIDVETANTSLASICQIGIARYESGRLCEEWKSYVDPQERFNGINISIHGIDEAVVEGAPTFPQLAGALHSYLHGTVVISHTYFDRTAIHQAARKYGIDPPESTWLDSARIARRAWKDRALPGYGLRDVCKMLGYEFRHHDALEDARASAYIVLAAISEAGLGVEAWFGRSRQPPPAVDRK